MTDATYNRLVAELANRCAASESGTMLAVTDTNHAVRLMVRNGAIAAVIYRKLHGMAALKQLLGTSIRKYNFAGDMVIAKTDSDLPPTADILRLLRTPPGVNQNLSITPDAGARGRVREIVEAELMETLGPMGKLICDEYFARGITDVDQLLTVISQEIDDSDQAWEFKERALRKLQL